MTVGTRSVNRAWNRRWLREAYLERQLRLVRLVLLLFTFCAVLLLMCAQARADALLAPDAGPADAGDYRVTQVDAGDPAPFTGWELGWQGAEQLARAGLVDAGPAPLAAAPPPTPPESSSCTSFTVTAFVAFALGAAAVAYLKR